jgi:alpha-galactosidase
MKKVCFAGCVLIAAAASVAAGGQAVPHSIREGLLSVEVSRDGSYALSSSLISGPVIRSTISADMMGTVLQSALYPRHTTSVERFRDVLGAGETLRVRHSGLPKLPDLTCEIRLYTNQPWGTIQISLENTTAAPVHVHALRLLETTDPHPVQLGGPDAADRILSDSFSEDSPALRIADLDASETGLHRGFGSQLIYNRTSGNGLFLGALTAERFLTLVNLATTGKGSDARITSLQAEATGTQDGEPDQATAYPASNKVPLNVEVKPGESLPSEPVMFAIGSDYHQQLEMYGSAVRIQNKARVTTPTPVGWWSWTAFYYGVTQASVLTNAQWLAQNLKQLGYRYFQVDEGYGYARGEYATSDKRAFRDGMSFVGEQVRGMGLTFGVWVAPFQVSERSWVYQKHPEWLVHTLDGKPVHIGRIAGKYDELYALDTTNPGAQDYLRYTYRTLVKDWGIRFIKMDFMDSSSVEGMFYRPNTSALQALRIGLQVIRDAVGNEVVLDKDGSPMLTPVGIVDAGRTSQDTGHTYESTRDAASGIAARYYMHRNFYVTDPDAFTVSTQTIPDRGWHGNKTPLTLDEAESSIALSAVSGGMFEIGDDLPTLGSSPERLALVRNTSLIDMARLGRASTPVDLMTYLPEDGQPSIFLLQESERQRIVTVFNWTENARTHSLPPQSLGIVPGHTYTVQDVLRGGDATTTHGEMFLEQPAYSVRMLKVIDMDVKEQAPQFHVELPTTIPAGSSLSLTAHNMGNSEPVLRYTWDFGDGVVLEGAVVQHAYTLAGQYTITATAFGIDDLTSQQKQPITVTGYVPTVYDPAGKERLDPGR